MLSAKQQIAPCDPGPLGIIVIGGHARNIGKTSVAASLIRAFPSLEWTAVKITQYGHGICSHDGKPCGCAPTGHPFALSEEKSGDEHTDTGRFLAAGARRSLWLRVRQGQLGEALPALMLALHGAKYVMVESNSILEFLKPDLYLIVLDGSRADFKESARRHLRLADAFMPMSDPPVSEAWAGVDARIIHGKPLFRPEPGTFSSAALGRFVQQKLT